MSVQNAQFGNLISSIFAVLPPSVELTVRTKDALGELGASFVIDLYEAFRNEASKCAKGPPAALDHPKPSTEQPELDEILHSIGERAVRPPANRWPSHEEAYLRAHFNTQPISKIAMHLGRSICATKAKATSLFLKRAICRGWSRSDIESLKRQYPRGSSVKEIAASLNRSVNAVRIKAAELDLFRDSNDSDNPVQGEPWTKAEIDYLRDHCGDDLADISAALGRSIRAVSNQYCNKGIRRSRSRTDKLAFRNAEIVRLRASGLRVAQIAERLGATVSAVGNVCTRHRAS